MQSSETEKYIQHKWVDAFRQSDFFNTLDGTGKTWKIHTTKKSRASQFQTAWINSQKNVPKLSEDIPTKSYMSTGAEYTMVNGKLIHMSTYILCFLMLNTAADFAHFINPTLVLIVSFVAIYAASVAFLFPFVRLTCTIEGVEKVWLTKRVHPFVLYIFFRLNTLHICLLQILIIGYLKCSEL